MIRILALVLAVALIAVFMSCQTCRVTSYNDAQQYSIRGYETRIAVYKTGLDGLLWGGFIWSYHAQAQVLVEDKWKWVGATGLSDTPTFSIQGEIIYWQPTIWHEYLNSTGRFY